MKATRPFSSDDFFREARKRAIVQAALRPESAVIIGLALLMIVLCAVRIFWFPGLWWAWALFGAAGAAVIIYSSMKDDKFIQRVSVNLFYERYDQSKLRLPELQANVSEALEYHRLLFQEIARRPYAPLSEVATDMDRLVAGVYHLAYSLDHFVSNEQIKRYLLNLLHTSQAQQDVPSEDASALTRALIVLGRNRKTAGAAYAAYEDAGMLENVCNAVAGAATEIQDTITNISAVHRRIATTGVKAADADWSFVEVVRSSFEDHFDNLHEKTNALDKLYHSCEVAAAGRKEASPQDE